MIRVLPGNASLGILLLVIIALDLSSAHARKPGLAAAAAVAEHLPALNDVLQQAEIDSAAVGALIDRMMDFRVFTRRTFGNYTRRALEEYDNHLSSDELTRLIARQQMRLVALFRERVVREFVDYVNESGLNRVELGAESANMSSSQEATLKLRSHLSNGKSIVIKLMIERRPKGWSVVDIIYDRSTLSEHYEREFKNVLKNDYSLSVLAAKLRREEFVRVEDFASTQEGAMPEGWYWRKNRDDDKPKLYEVQKAASANYLAAHDTGHSVILLKIAHWNPHEFPILTWCWRADALPPGGDERVTETNDSAAGVFVIFDENWLGLPIQNKYVWSTTLPEGTIGRRDMIARPYFLVAQSGDGSLGRWELEKVDLMEDYGRTFGGVPKTRTLGIGILTDSNNTHTYAEAYYADIRVWRREALETASIPDHCACLPGGDLTPRRQTETTRTDQ